MKNISSYTTYELIKIVRYFYNNFYLAKGETNKLYIHEDFLDHVDNYKLGTFEIMEFTPVTDYLRFEITVKYNKKEKYENYIPILMEMKALLNVMNIDDIFRNNGIVNINGVLYERFTKHITNRDDLKKFMDGLVQAEMIKKKINKMRIEQRFGL